MNNFKNLNEALYHLCDSLHDAPEVNSRGSKQKERIFQSFVIEDPTDLNITIPARKFNENYAIAEWLWYLSANGNAKNIGKLAKIWNMISDRHGQVESNYGIYLAPQWRWVVNELLNDNDTRRATFVINHSYHKYKNEKDYPCTHYIQFLIRDDKLHIGVNMRSNDVVYGLCNDVFTFALFQQLMLNELRSEGLKIKLGNYFHHAGSLHVYERHYNMLSKIKDESNKEYVDATNKKFVLKSGFTWNSTYGKFPSNDVSKEDIYNYVKKIKVEIFENE